MTPFHLAFTVDDLAAAEQFYAGLLGCKIGRRAERWIDFDFWGHQLSAHLVDDAVLQRDVERAPTNEVDGDDVPARHFGVVLDWDDWNALADRLQKANATFLIEPRVRFESEPGEQATFFLTDPSGNALEMKSFKDRTRMFAT